jgi:hypothetical protein
MSLEIFNKLKIEVPNNVFKTINEEEFIIYKGIKVTVGKDDELQIYSTESNSYHKFPIKYNFILKEYGIVNGVNYFNIYRMFSVLMKTERAIHTINPHISDENIVSKKIDRLEVLFKIKENCELIKNM